MQNHPSNDKNENNDLLPQYWAHNTKYWKPCIANGRHKCQVSEAVVWGWVWAPKSIWQRGEPTNHPTGFRFYIGQPMLTFDLLTLRLQPPGSRNFGKVHQLLEDPLNPSIISLSMLQLCNWYSEGKSLWMRLQASLLQCSWMMDLKHEATGNRWHWMPSTSAELHG